MQAAVPLACFLSVIRPPGVQYENSLLQVVPVDKSKCPFVREGNDVAFQLFTRHNPTVFQELKIDDDEKLFASNMDFNDKTVVYFHAWMETPEDGSAVMVREAYMQRGDTNVIMVDARSLEAGPWYFTAAQNTWHIGIFTAHFIDYLVSRGLNLNNTHLVGHSLGAHVAGVAGSALKSGQVARITGLDAALPLFEGLPLPQRLDPSDAKFVDVIHTDAGIFGYKAPMGHVDFYPNGGISPQPGCELEVVIPQQLLLNKCDKHTRTNGFYTYYLRGKGESHLQRDSLEYKLEKLFTFIQAVRAKSKMDGEVAIDKVKANIHSLYDFKDTIVDYLKDDNVDEKRIIDQKDGVSTEGTSFKEYSELNDEKSNTSVTADGVIIEEVNKFECRNITSTDIEKDIEDQIIEESNYYSKVKLDEVNINENTKESEPVVMKENTVNVKSRTKRDADTNQNSRTIELTVVSGNLTLNNEKDTKDILGPKNSGSNATVDTVVKTIKDIARSGNKDNAAVNTPTLDHKPTVTTLEDDFQITLDNENEQVINPKISNNKGNIPKPLQFNLFRRRPLLGLIIRNLPKITQRNKIKSKYNKPKFGKIVSERVESKFSKTGPAKLASKFRELDNKINNKLLRRQKRFLPFFQRAEDSNSILFKMLDFLIKNRKNVLPVFTVMREINTFVRSANGELNHFSKESNNYIGATPPAFTPITYNLELGNENKVVAFVKKILGVIPKGDRLSISGTGK